MSAETSSTPAVTITTVGQFYDAFDAEFTRLQAIKDWCEQGRTTAYNMIPARPASAAVPAEYLTDEGKAWQAAQETTTVAALQATVRRNVRRHINDYLSLEEANEAITALGCEPYVRESNNRGSYSAYGYFTTPAQMGRDNRLALSQAMSAAATAALAEFAASHPDISLTVDEGNPGSCNVESDRYADVTIT